MPHAHGYMRVSLYGTVFVFGYNAVCSIMRGLGDSKSPLAYVALASAVNVALDLVLVGALGMGTRGAARRHGRVARAGLRDRLNPNAPGRRQGRATARAASGSAASA